MEIAKRKPSSNRSILARYLSSVIDWRTYGSIVLALFQLFLAVVEFSAFFTLFGISIGTIVLCCLGVLLCIGLLELCQLLLYWDIVLGRNLAQITDMSDQQGGQYDALLLVNDEEVNEFKPVLEEAVKNSWNKRLFVRLRDHEWSANWPGIMYISLFKLPLSIGVFTVTVILVALPLGLIANIILFFACPSCGEVQGSWSTFVYLLMRTPLGIILGGVVGIIILPLCLHLVQNIVGVMVRVPIYIMQTYYRK